MWVQFAAGPLAHGAKEMVRPITLGRTDEQPSFISDDVHLSAASRSTSASYAAVAD
jgi:hypothetical protein